MDFLQIELALRQSPLFQELFEITQSGDYSRFDNEAIRQHFIPQFLLRGFGTEQDDERLYQLDVRRGTNHRVRVDEAASRRHFYAISDQDGNRSNQIEGFLAMVESHAAPALARLLADPENLSVEDRGTLAFFFALLDQRTPSATARTGQTADTIMRMLYASEFSDAEAFAERYREIFPPGEGEEPATDDEIETMRAEMLDALREGRVSFADPQVEALRMGINVAGQQCYFIYGMRWTILRCVGGFVTSDRGLAIYDPEPEYPWSSEALLSSNAAETTIPLSSDTCLMLTLGDEPLEVREIDQTEADGTNLRTYGWADSYIFGASQEAVTRVRRLARERPMRVLRSKPFQQVLLMDASPQDTSLADRNRARGWPPYLPLDGVPHDYIVFRYDENPMSQLAMMSETVKERARRALNIAEGDHVPGREEIVNLPLHQVGSGFGLPGDTQRQWSEFVAFTQQQQQELEQSGTAQDS